MALGVLHQPPRRRGRVTRSPVRHVPEWGNPSATGHVDAAGAALGGRLLGRAHLRADPRAEPGWTSTGVAGQPGRFGRSAAPAFVVVELLTRQPVAPARPLSVPPVQRSQRCHLRRLRRARRHLVPLAGRAPAGRSHYSPLASGLGPASGHRHHARVLGALGPSLPHVSVHACR